MAKIGSYDYPKTQIGTLLKATEVLVLKFGGEAKDEKTFAEAIGHSTTNSGGYQTKIADLRRYGFMEARTFVATPRAKHIVQPLTQGERSTNLSEAVLSVPLWRDLHKKLGKNTTSVEDFRIQLVQITGDRDRAMADGEAIQNLYLDAIQHIGEGPVQSSTAQSESETAKEPRSAASTTQLTEAKSGDVRITLPKTAKSIEIARKLLDVLELQINDNPGEEK